MVLFTLHPAPCTLHPAPCTLHPAPSVYGPSPRRSGNPWRLRRKVSTTWSALLTMTPQGIAAPLSSSYSFLPPYLLTLPFFHLLLLPVLTSPAFPPSTSPFCRYFVEEEANRKEREGDGTILKVSISVTVSVTVTYSSCRPVLTVRRRNSFTCRSSASTSSTQTGKIVQGELGGDLLLPQDLPPAGQVRQHQDNAGGPDGGQHHHCHPAKAHH